MFLTFLEFWCRQKASEWRAIQAIVVHFVIRKIWDQINCIFCCISSIHLQIICYHTFFFYFLFVVMDWDTKYFLCSSCEFSNYLLEMNLIILPTTKECWQTHKDRVLSRWLIVHNKLQVNTCSYAIRFSHRCNVQTSSHSYLLIDQYPTNSTYKPSERDFLWYHSTIFSSIFLDILAKVLVKTYPLFMRKKQTCLWHRSMQMRHEL